MIFFKTIKTKQIILSILIVLFSYTANARDNYSLQTGTYSVLNKVQKDLDDGKNEEALKKLEKIISSGNIKDYDSAVIYQTIGFIQNNLGDFKAAAENYTKALSYEALPEDITHGLYYTITQLLIYTEKYQEGIEYILKWFAKEKEPKAEAYILAATAYYYLENYSEVINFASKALPLIRTPPLNWYELLLAGYYETEDLNNAAIILENIIVKYPTKKKYWIQLAGIYQRLEDDKKALAIYELAYAKDFLKKKQIIQLCKNYLYFEMPHKAAVILEKEMATGRIDNNLEMLNMLVDAWILAQESEKAESVFTEIINSYNDELTMVVISIGGIYADPFYNYFCNYLPSPTPIPSSC